MAAINMKMIQKYPYLFCLALCAAVGLAAGIAGMTRLSSGQELGSYLQYHLTQPFWTELLPDSSGISESYAEGGKSSYQKNEADHGGSADVSGNAAADQTSSSAGASLSGNDPAQSVSQEEPVRTEDPSQQDGGNASEETQSAGAQPVGKTEFVSYTPVATDSPYYTDSGLTALTTEYPYTTVDDSYFDDAAFIGDSRTLGLHDYAGWEDRADFYCENGFSVYQWTKGAKVRFQETGRDVDLQQALAAKKYGKIYLMVGMNDLGYGNTDNFSEWLTQLLNMIEQEEPDAVIYLMGNLHISREQNGKRVEMNNINVNEKNVAIARLADGVRTFYLDCNPLFTDDQGYLKSDLTFDGFHLYAANYPVWTDFIRSHAVVK